MQPDTHTIVKVRTTTTMIAQEFASSQPTVCLFWEEREVLWVKAGRENRLTTAIEMAWLAAHLHSVSKG